MDSEHLDPIAAAWACRQRFAEVQRLYYRAVREDWTLHRADSSCPHGGDGDECRRARTVIAVRSLIGPIASELAGWLTEFNVDPKPLNDLLVVSITGQYVDIDEAMWAADGAIARLVRELRGRRAREKQAYLLGMDRLATTALQAGSREPRSTDTSPGPTGIEQGSSSRQTGEDGPSAPAADPRTLYLTEDGRGLRLGSKELGYSKGKLWQRVTLRSAEGQLLVACVPPPRVRRRFTKDVVSRLRRALRQSSDAAVRLEREEGELVLIPALKLAPSLQAEVERRRRPGLTQ